jgi:hypothetical protein
MTDPGSAQDGSAQDTVCLAVDLGWLLAELYDSRKLPPPSRTPRCCRPAVSRDCSRSGRHSPTRPPGPTGSSLGRVVQQAEHAMWEAEVVAAIGKAATISPGKQGDQPVPVLDDEPAPAASLPSAAGGWPSA